MVVPFLTPIASRRDTHTEFQATTRQTWATVWLHRSSDAEAETDAKEEDL